MPVHDDVIDRPDTTVKPKKEEKTGHPKQYQVVMFNDDFTPYEFVVMMLMRFFGKSQQEAEALMWSIHRTGKGVCGVYSKDVAETKAKEVMDWARHEQHPLRLEVEIAP
jgi:ATP-dependent Clp protease adaptor protein ClpS